MFVHVIEIHRLHLNLQSFTSTHWYASVPWIPVHRVHYSGIQTEMGHGASDSEFRQSSRCNKTAHHMLLVTNVHGKGPLSDPAFGPGTSRSWQLEGGAPYREQSPTPSVLNFYVLASAFPPGLCQGEQGPALRSSQTSVRSKQAVCAIRIQQRGKWQATGCKPEHVWKLQLSFPETLPAAPPCEGNEPWQRVPVPRFSTRYQLCRREEGRRGCAVWCKSIAWQALSWGRFLWWQRGNLGTVILG